MDVFNRWMLSQSVEEADHYYVSPACVHDKHGRCRLNCQWCGAACLCRCHQGTAREQIAYVANAEFPREACGFILRSGAAVQCSNVAEEPLGGFRMDQSEVEEWWVTGMVAGVWHSHPAASAVPSEEDQALAVPGLEFWIYSVTDEDLAVYHLDEQGRLQLVRLEGPE